MSEQFPPEHHDGTPIPNGMHGEIVDYSNSDTRQPATTVDGGAVTRSRALNHVLDDAPHHRRDSRPGHCARSQTQNPPRPTGALGSTSIVTAAPIIAALNIFTCLALAALIVAADQSPFLGNHTRVDPYPYRGLQHGGAAETPIELIQSVYSHLGANVSIARQRLGRAVTLSEKILFNHLADRILNPSRRARVTPSSTPIAWRCKMPRANGAPSIHDRRAATSGRAVHGAL